METPICFYNVFIAIPEFTKTLQRLCSIAPRNPIPPQQPASQVRQLSTRLLPAQALQVARQRLNFALTWQANSFACPVIAIAATKLPQNKTNK
jgi:hypothetical protein